MPKNRERQEFWRKEILSVREMADTEPAIGERPDSPAEDDDDGTADNYNNRRRYWGCHEAD